MSADYPHKWPDLLDKMIANEPRDGRMSKEITTIFGTIFTVVRDSIDTSAMELVID